MQETTKIVFTGDIGFDHYMDNGWKNPELLDRDVISFISDCDHLIVNVEGPLSDGKRNTIDGAAGNLIHSMSPEVGGFLKGIGADIWNICNNHIMDAGPVGLEDTLHVAEAHDCKTIGAGMNIEDAANPLILDEAGGIGIFAVGYQRACRKADEETPGCLSWADMDRIRHNIEEIKKTCRWCIIVAHGGEEFTSLPAPYTRDRYHEYLNMGCDIVVGHHPHVPMNYELVGDKAIFYSLGNFIFDTDYQRAQYNTEKGIVLSLSLSADGFTFTPLGIRIDRENQGVRKGELPLIFTDVDEEEYELLEPLSAKAFIAATKRQLKYLKPDRYNDATTEQEWHDNFYEPLRSGRVPGECLDMQIIVPIAAKAEEGAWKKSRLTDVQKFILEQM